MTATPRRGLARRMRAAWRALPVAIVLLAPGAVAMAAAPDFVPPAPVEKTLDNGLRVVVFVDARLPIAQVQLFVPAGLVAEPADQPGVAHLTAQMLERGTPTRDAARLASEMGALGSELTVTTLRDYTVVGAGLLAGDLEAGLGIMADAVMHPLFSNEALGRLRYEVARTLIELHHNPVSTAEEQVWPLAFENHPYGRTPAGEVADLLRRTREELQAFHAAHYLPKGSVLAVAGDVKAAEVFEMARQSFGEWQGTAAPVPSIMVGPGSLKPHVRIIDVPSGGRTEIRIAAAAPERGSPQSLPFSIASSVFADIGAARLAARPAWPGVIGGVSSGYTALRDAGLFVTRATVRTDSAGAAVESLRNAVAALGAEPPAAAEIAAAKTLWRETWPMTLSSLAGLLGAWGNADWYGVADETIHGEAGVLDTLADATVDATVRRWIEPGRLAILAVGPAEQLKPLLARFGEVEVVKIDDSAQAEWASREVTEKDRSRGREIVAAGVKAHGGLNNLRSLKDSSIDATLVLNAQGREVDGRIRQARKEPFRFREIMSVFLYESEQVLIGDHGWVYETQNNRVEVADSMQVATMRSNYLNDLPHLLLQATEEGADPIFRGRETVDGRPADLVEVRLQSEEHQLWLLFDAETHELIASDVRGGIPPHVLARRVFSDFRQVKKLRLPYSEVRYVQNKEIMRIKVNECGYNIGIADNLFRVPEVRN